MKKMQDGLRIAGMMAGLLAVMPASVSYAQMSLPGSFEVSDTGAASYAIPIAVPPGTAGMQPSLSLTYSSQSGNGLLGMGWSLSGLPTVTRCPKTTAQDGAVGGINYDTNDRFCLEGQRLIAITGTYGADQTEYRTERESFSKIVSYGSAGTGPAWFKVWSKSGQVMEFGNTADSRVEAEAKTTARLWAVNKIGDTKGNYIAISYAEDNTNGEYRPTRIDYTGNSGAGVSPFASVRFTYESRPDGTTFYEAGSLIKTTQRLASIGTFVGEALVLQYQLSYETSATTQRSRVTSIRLCDAGAACLPQTNFSATSAGDGSFTAIQSTYPSGWNFGQPIQHTLVVGDFNADGRTDYVLTSGQVLNAFLSNGDGTFAAVQSTYPNGWNFGQPVPHTLVAGDFNGDGRTDFMFTSGQMRDVFLSNGDGTFAAVQSTYPTGWNFGLPVQHLLIVGDFNGDGKTDYLFTSGNSREVFLSNGDGTFAATQSNYPAGWSYALPIQHAVVIGDFNGDGRTDYLLTSNTTREVFLSNGNGSFAAIQSSYPPGWSFGLPTQHMLIPGDFNGDGKTDYLFTSGNSREVFISRGDGTFSASQSNYPAGWNYGLPIQHFLIVGDFNGDGLTDYSLSSNTTREVFIGKGDGSFFASQSFYPSGWNFGLPTQFTLVPGDFNGDGKSDYLLTSGQVIDAFLQNGVIPDQTSAISSGTGTETSVSYLPATISTIYTKGSGASFPTVDIQAPMNVVSEVQTSNGVGGSYRSTYKYANARMHVQGRGFLGFESVTAKDEQTLVEQLTTYLQAHPYTGLIASRVKKLGATTLNETVNTYGSNDLGGGRSFVFLQQSVEKSWELNGSLVSQVTTTHQYDAYGNATQVAVTTPDGYSKTTANTYTNDTLNWLLGRLTRASVTSVTPN